MLEIIILIRIKNNKMDSSNKKINIQNSFEYDIQNLQSEFNQELQIEKRIKKLLIKSNKNIRDSILTGEIKINLSNI